MKLGIGSYAYYWATGVPNYPPEKPMTALDFLERCAELDVALVQFADNLPLHTLPGSEIDALVRRAGELEIEVELGTRGIRPEHLEPYLELAARFDANILRTVVDTTDHHPTPEEVVESVCAMLGAFESAGVTLAIENHDRFTSGELAAIIQKIDHPQVGICLDTVNSFGALEGPDVVVEALGPYTVNLHLKEFVIERSRFVMGFDLTGAPAGKGRLNIPWLIEKLGAFGRQPNGILELWPPPEDTVAESMAKEHQWVVESLAYLRALPHFS